MRFFLLTILIFTIGSCASAQDSGDWPAAQARLGEISGSTTMKPDEKCQAMWGIVWPLAKEGNLDAREALMDYITYNPRGIPGRSGDKISVSRDFTILAVHSIGSQKMLEEARVHPERYLVFFEKLLSPMVKPNDRFLICMRGVASQNCTDIAVDERMVPSFADFAADVDLSVSQGMKPVCGEVSP